MRATRYNVYTATPTSVQTARPGNSRMAHPTRCISGVSDCRSRAENDFDRHRSTFAPSPVSVPLAASLLSALETRADNSKLLHPVDQRGALHAKFDGCTFRAAITQPTASRVRRISSRSGPSKVVGGPEGTLVSCRAQRIPSTPSLRITARSIKFCSSRYFPATRAAECRHRS